MKIKNKFIFSLIIFLAALLLLCGGFLIYVNVVVSEYDRVQPENIVETQINKLKDGSLLSEINFEKLCTNRYENNDPEKFKQEYSSKVVGKDLTYKIVASESGELRKTYVIKSGEENVGKIVLNGKNPRTKLLFFTSADWSMSEFTPTISMTVYNLRIYCPEGIKATINGVVPSEEEREKQSQIPLYSVSGLLNDPTIKFTDGEGNEIPYMVEENTVKPVLFDYHITLPKGMTVLVNENAVTGTASGDDVIYRIREMEKPAVVIKDCMGMTYEYADNEEIPLFDYSIFIPENCTLSIDGAALPEPKISDDPDAEKLLKYAGVTLPKKKGYTFSLFSDSVSATVADSAVSKNFNVPYGTANLSPETLDAVPEDIAKEIDVLSVMKLWSKFMTNDVGGGDRGYSAVSKYLIPGSEYQEYARQWAFGIDISFVSDHILKDFTNESVSNFTSYGSGCFSCSVYFEKNMDLIYNNNYVGSRTDVFNSIVYFTKIDNGSWRIAIMHDDLEGENNGGE